MGNQELWQTDWGHLVITLEAEYEQALLVHSSAFNAFLAYKEVHQSCILSSCLFNLYAEYIMRNAGLEEAHLESRLPGEIAITSDMQMTPPLRQKAKKN